MDDNKTAVATTDESELFSQEWERDARRYGKLFTEEEEVRLI